MKWLTFLGFLICCWLVYSCGHNRRSRIYLIPEGFFGKVYLVFDQNDGTRVKNESGSVVYHIGSDGTLKTEGPFIAGSVKSQFFYITSDGKRVRLNYYDWIDLTDAKKNHLLDSSTAFVFKMEWGLAPSQGKTKKFETFYVVSIRNFDSVINNVKYFYDKPIGN